MVIASPEFALETRSLSKSFSGNRVLRDIDFQVRPGEVMALVGENGCGKSTLIKCLAGYYQADPGGEIIVNGVRVPPDYEATQSSALGMSFIHQDLGLIPELSVLENLFLGQRMPMAFPARIQWKKAATLCRVILTEFGHPEIDPFTLIAHIPRAMQTVVALARCLYRDDTKVIVMDEPTAALPQQEVEKLFGAIRIATKRGVAVVYVSHHLEEIFEISDRVTVLRDGAHIATRATSELSRQKLVDLIVGREMSEYYPTERTKELGPIILEAREISGIRVRSLNLTLRRGEIVGITGLLGCGRSEVGRLLFGAQPLTGGHVLLDSKPVQFKTPTDAVHRKVGYVPENRLRDGIHREMSLSDNVNLLRLNKFMATGFLSAHRLAAAARVNLATFKVRPPVPSKLIGTLSGGNQQKAVLAKWMNLEPIVLILDEPVQGVDIGAKTDVYAIISDAADRGTGVLMLGSEIDDMAEVCDRVIVLRDGVQVAELTGRALTAKNLSAVMYEEVPA